MVSEGRPLPTGLPRCCSINLYDGPSAFLALPPPATPGFVSEVAINPGWVSIWMEWKKQALPACALSNLDVARFSTYMSNMCLCDINKPAGPVWDYSHYQTALFLIDSNSVSFRWYRRETCVCVESRDGGPVCSSRAARVWNSPTRARLERFSIQSGSLKLCLCAPKKKKRRRGGWIIQQILLGVIHKSAFKINKHSCGGILKEAAAREAKWVTPVR